MNLPGALRCSACGAPLTAKKSAPPGAPEKPEDPSAKTETGRADPGSGEEKPEGSPEPPSEEAEDGSGTDASSPKPVVKPPSFAAVPLGKRREEPRRHKADKVGRCAFCHGVFGPGELYDVGGRKVCETCLPRAEGQLARGGGGGEGGGDDRRSNRYLKEQYIAERLQDQGRHATHMTLKWPKCYRHPDRSTKDVCSVCKKPICAMCTRRRGDRLYCPDCFGKASSVITGKVSSKFGGFGGSYFETVKEVLFGPSVFFRNLPTRGEIFRPFLFALVNWIPGNTVMFLGVSILYARLTGQVIDIDSLAEVLLTPLVRSVPVLSVGVASLGWLPFHLVALAVGGRAPAEKGFRMACLASAFSLMNIIPFAGILLAPLFAAGVLLRGVSEVYKLDLFRAFLVFLIGFGSWVAAVVGFVTLVIFPAI